MKVPIRWLEDYVALPASQKVLTDRLTAIGHMQDHPPVEVAGTPVLDLEIRQNRSDCLSIIGIAREVSAATSQALKLPPQPTQVDLGKNTDTLVSIEPGTACYRFHAIKFEGVKIAPSPEWLTERLTAYGIKSINNVVDITNFVMVELGEPLHAFDAAQLQGNLVIRQAKSGESFTMLGDRTIKLDPTDVVVADQQGVVAMGGMIGGASSGVSAQTSTIILEAATYNQANIRRSSLRHSLRTEASLRHEKFLHTDLTELALRRAADLLQTLAGAKAVEQTDAITKLEPITTITLRHQRLTTLAAIEIPVTEARAILERLGLQVIEALPDSFKVQIPYFRTDLVQEADVIEEVLRIYGYDLIPDRLPGTPPPKDLSSAEYQLEEEIRDILVGFGFDEQIIDPLTKENDPVLTPVVLQNSLNSEKTMLRTTLQTGLEAAHTYQTKFRKRDIALFEVGRVYTHVGDTYQEKKMIAGLISGPQVTQVVVKGYLEAIYLRLGLVVPTQDINLQMINSTTGYFELALADLLAAQRSTASSLRTSVPQVVFEDISLKVPNAVKVGEVIAAVAEVSPSIYRVELGEYPRALGDEEKSVFLKLQFMSAAGQIQADEVIATRQKIVGMLNTRFGATLR